ncbi:MAG: hypothetical protein HKUEN01_15710 [Candidatus Kuenenia stuttgartiensis]|nr:MAG: hypothetical protein HKUEN01_15710 [Candidatus Kuenenia stuttgartiensis]
MRTKRKGNILECFMKRSIIMPPAKSNNTNGMVRRMCSGRNLYIPNGKRNPRNMVSPLMK